MAQPKSSPFVPSLSPQSKHEYASAPSPPPSISLSYPSFYASPSAPPSSAWYNFNSSAAAYFSIAGPSRREYSAPILAKPLGDGNWPRASALTSLTEEELQTYKNRLEILEVFGRSVREDNKPLRHLLHEAHAEMKRLIAIHVERAHGVAVPTRNKKGTTKEAQNVTVSVVAKGEREGGVGKGIREEVADSDDGSEAMDLETSDSGEESGYTADAVFCH